MKVLHVYSGNLYGGIETVLFTLARLRHLCPQMQPEFALCFRGRLWDEIASTGVPLYDLKQVKFSRPWTVIRARMRLRTLILEKRYDAIACHACWPHVLFGPVVRRNKTKLIGYLHDALGGKHWLEKAAGRIGADLLIANSHFTATRSSSVFRGIQTKVVYLPVEKSTPADSVLERVALRNELRTSVEDVVILQASRLERMKGQSVLIHALVKLKEVPGWTAWVAGGHQREIEKTYMDELKQLTLDAGIQDRVRFLGQRTDVRSLMNASDIYCQPNTSPEAFGISFIEALYAGLPIVTSNIGGGSEIVDKSCGILTPVSDIIAVSNALRTLIMNFDERRRLGFTGPSRANELCNPIMAMTRSHDVISEMFGS